MQELPRLTPSHALFLDFDGTLVDIASQPDAVRVEEGLIPALRTLELWLQGALAIVTGRTLVEIDHYLAPLQLHVASEHGAHSRMAAGYADHPTDHRDARMAPPGLNAAVERLRTALLQYPSLLLETKTSGFALHYRNALALEPVCSRLMDEVARDLPGMEVLRGKHVLELKPAGPNKGRAVNDFMQLPAFQGRTPIFVGDDITDESAFIVVLRRGGVGIKVGPGATLAKVRCETAAQVREWLLLCASGAQEK